MADDKQMPGYMKFVLSGLAGISVAVLVQPLDLIKTRMQIASVVGKNKEYKNAYDCFRKVVQNEGILKCWQGLDAGILRQATYTTVRMGVYQVLVDAYKTNISTTPSLPASMFFGIVAGTAGALVGNPSEVALIRMLTDAKLPEAEKRYYKHVGDALRHIAKEEGTAGLWSGCGAMVARAMVVNMCQLSSYSHIKHYLREKPFHMEENYSLHIMASICSGFISSVASLPLDTAKTLIQTMKSVPGVKPKYSGTTDVLIKIVKSDGVIALWRGLTLYFFRMAPRTTLTFVFLEQFNNLYYEYVMGIKGGTHL